MALSSHMLRTLHSFAKEGDRVASVGYPDIISPKVEIDRVLGAKSSSLAYREDSADIVKWHGAVESRIPTAESFFDLMGLRLDVYDVAAHRGGEIIRDFNYPLPVSDLERYDFVLDVGSLEHCFNIAQAAFNMAGLLKKGGVILHENPFNQGNHGFYGLNPTWYSDFYQKNGFKLLELGMVTREGQEVTGIPQTDRFILSGGETSIVVAARRTAIQSLKFPVQHKYAKMIGALHA